jgi:hypothetical protein
MPIKINMTAGRMSFSPELHGKDGLDGFKPIGTLEIEAGGVVGEDPVGGVLVEFGD